MSLGEVLDFSFYFDILGDGLVCLGTFGHVWEMFLLNVLACLAMLRHVLECFVPLWYPWEWFGLLWYVLASLRRCSG